MNLLVGSLNVPLRLRISEKKKDLTLSDLVSAEVTVTKPDGTEIVFSDVPVVGERLELIIDEFDQAGVWAARPFLIFESSVSVPGITARFRVEEE